VSTSEKVTTSLLGRFASRLRFPTLFFLTAGLFLLDLWIPDLIPFADEVLLGLATVLLGMWKRRRDGETEGETGGETDGEPPGEGPVIDIESGPD